MPRQFTLGKNERIKSRKMIEQLFNDGKSFALHPYRVYYKIYTGTGVQFGVGVSSRNFKKAVDRNRIKRLTREAYRLEQKNQLQEMLKEKALHVFFIYTDKELPQFSTVKEKLQLILNKLSRIIHENNSPDT